MPDGLTSRVLLPCLVLPSGLGVVTTRILQHVYDFFGWLWQEVALRRDVSILWRGGGPLVQDEWNSSLVEASE